MRKAERQEPPVSLPWPRHAMAWHALPCYSTKRFNSFPNVSAQARSASPSLSFPPEDPLPHFPFWTFPRALCRPREFVVTLVPPCGQAPLACPLSGLDASSLLLQCPSVP